MRSKCFSNVKPNMETYERSDFVGIDSDKSLLDRNDNNATPTSKDAMVMTSESQFNTNSNQLDRYARTMSDNGDTFESSQDKTPPNAFTHNRSKLRQPEELQHISEMSGSQGSEGQVKTETNSRHSSISSVRVEIQDLGEESINFTTSTLRKCKKMVLNPYWGLLVFIGWRAFRKDTILAQNRKWRILNIGYTLTIILLLFYTYTYEIMACEWRLDVTKDDKVVTPATVGPIASTPNRSIIRQGGLGLQPSDSPSSFHVPGPNESTVEASHNVGCDHIVTSYLIPNVLHLLSYIMGIYYFRVQENEQLYALMEKVFLQATPLQARTASQHKMIIKLRLFLAVGTVWVFATVLLQCLYVVAFDFPKLSLFESTGTSGYWLMFSFELIGRAVFNSVILAIVMNFGTQCEMVKFYVRGLTMRLQEKSTDLKTAMKDILLLRHSLGILNGIISKMTSFAAFILAELTIIGICILFANKIDTPLVWAYRSLFPLVWAPMLAFPLFQGARVNSICLRIQKIAIEIRVFGYKGASILDLDSFLQFTMLTKLRAKLLHIPLLPSHLIFTLVFAAFVILILLQTSSIGSGQYIF